MRPLLSALFAVFALLVGPSVAAAQHAVDYRDAPAAWFTPICFVDDWQKSLVDQDGRLVYDFGPGPYASPKTVISVEVDGASADSTTQTLLNARVPVMLTSHVGEKGSWSQSAFSLTPDNLQPPDGYASDGSFRRLEGLTGSVAWAPAAEGVDAAFRSVAWGTGRSVRYDVRVPGGSRRRVALGFNEVYRSGRILRLMDLLVEGAASRTVDLVELGDRGVPQVFFFDAADEDGDGWLNVEVTGSRRTQDPNVFLNGIWVFDESAPASDPISAADVVAGRATPVAENFVDAGAELEHLGRRRRDALRTTLAHGADGPLVVRVETLRPLVVDQSGGSLLFTDHPFVTTRPAFSKATQRDGVWLLAFEEATRSVDVLVTHGSDPTSDGRATPDRFPDLVDELRRTVSYWQSVDLPWGRMTVPDPDIQDLLDGGIRTMYQIREVVDGFAQFQPGPTVYRGLWYGDGTWAAETAALLDDRAAAVDVLDAMLAHQEPDGRVGVMKPALLHRETAHLIFGMSRYARLHADRDWLRDRWPRFAAAVQSLIDLRARASADSTQLWAGLYPPGFTDGGIGGVGASYGSVYWGLIGIAASVRAAHWMNQPEAAAWQNELDSFLAAFRRAAERDARRDEDGNLFLPIKMDFDPEQDAPQRGQWGPIHALYTEQVLDDDDPLVTGTFAMLESKAESDMVITSGWLKNGVWPIFEAHRALGYNWLRQADRAEDLLYAFANHASPTLVWVEEQMPTGKGTRTAGDVPHTVGNMQVVRLVRYLTVLERGDDLELLGGVPLTWLRPGAHLDMQSLPTLFGPVTVRLELSDDGDRGNLWIQTPSPETEAGSPVVFLNRLKRAGYVQNDLGQNLPDRVTIGWGEQYRLSFRRAR